MATIDIFNDNAFTLLEMAAALEDVPFQPQQLGSMGIFTQSSVRTEFVSIERRENTLNLVQTTLRGEPLPQLSTNGRNIRAFKAPRLAKGDRLNASEIAGIRAFGTDSELMQVQTEVLDRQIRLRRDLDLTQENMRLGAVQGIVLDADGTELFNWFTEWGIAQPAEQTFDFTTLIDGKLREKCNQIIRAMMRAAKGAWNGSARVGAICGDEFYDNLIRAKEVRDTYLGWQAAADLRRASVWEAFPFGNIDWMNYRGTDDGSKVAVAPTKCKFFPIGAPDAFMKVLTPGEFFDTINQPGRDYYPLTIPDEKRNAFVDLELYSYPLYVATRPAMLLRGKL